MESFCLDWVHRCQRCGSMVTTPAAREVIGHQVLAAVAYFRFRQVFYRSTTRLSISDVLYYSLAGLTCASAVRTRRLPQWLLAIFASSAHCSCPFCPSTGENLQLVIDLEGVLLMLRALPCFIIGAVKAWRDPQLRDFIVNPSPSPTEALGDRIMARRGFLGKAWRWLFLTLNYVGQTLTIPYLHLLQVSLAHDLFPNNLVAGVCSTLTPLIRCCSAAAVTLYPDYVRATSPQYLYGRTVATQCSICLEGGGSLISVCSATQHGFHKECIVQWQESSVGRRGRRCPVCSSAMQHKASPWRYAAKVSSIFISSFALWWQIFGWHPQLFCSTASRTEDMLRSLSAVI